MKKVFISIILVFLMMSFCSCCFSMNSYATDEDTVISKMSKTTDLDSTIKGDNGVGGVINLTIGLIQIAGTGISVITVTLLGAKYILSSPEQKADIKNRAMPVVIGMIILFGSVNLVAIVGNLTNAAFQT